MLWIPVMRPILRWPLTAEVMQMFQVLKADGCGQEDHSALEKYYEKLTGTKVGE